jgi:hypothetical protein
MFDLGWNVRNFDVFISYAYDDKSTADAVRAALEAGVVRCWMAPRDVPPGTPWADAVDYAIDNCKAGPRTSPYCGGRIAGG